MSGSERVAITIWEPAGSVSTTWRITATLTASVTSCTSSNASRNGVRSAMQRVRVCNIAALSMGARWSITATAAASNGESMCRPDINRESNALAALSEGFRGAQITGRSQSLAHQFSSAVDFPYPAGAEINTTLRSWLAWRTASSAGRLTSLARLGGGPRATSRKPAWRAPDETPAPTITRPLDT